MTERAGAIHAVDRVYRALYGGVLARLPERSAIAVGQWALRWLPLDRPSVWRRDEPRLRTALGGVVLPNPCILSSMYYDTRILGRAMGLGFGAVTAKSITPGPRPGHPPPNLVRVDTPEGPGLVNCNGFKNPGLAAYRRDVAGLRHRVPLIVAAAGESADDYVEVVRGLEPFGDLVEINISSPNTRLVYEWSTRPAELGALFDAVRRATAKPVIVKISPDFRDVNEATIVPAALDAGIRIVNYGNTRRVEEPRLSQRAGGLSGPADSRGDARQREAPARPLRRPPRDHRHRRHRQPRPRAPGLRRRRHRVRVVHRVRHPRPRAGPSRVRRAARPALIIPNLSTYPPASTTRDLPRL